MSAGRADQFCRVVTTTMIPAATMLVPTQVQIFVFSCRINALAVRTARKPMALNGYATLSGTRLNVVIQASAEMPKTVSPTQTKGDEAAVRTSDRPVVVAAAAAPDMPCRHRIWPRAAGLMANSG